MGLEQIRMELVIWCGDDELKESKKLLREVKQWLSHLKN